MSSPLPLPSHTYSLHYCITSCRRDTDRSVCSQLISCLTMSLSNQSTRVTNNVSHDIHLNVTNMQSFLAKARHTSEPYLKRLVRRTCPLSATVLSRSPLHKSGTLCRRTFVHPSSSSYMSHWSSGSTLACCARGPRFQSRCGHKFVFSRKKITEIRSFGHGLHTDCSA